MKHVRLLCLSLLLVCRATAFAEDPPAQAKELFDRYVALDKAFDPAIADLYSDEAKIAITRISPEGEKRTSEIPASKYKDQIRLAMSMAKITEDKTAYTEVKYAQDGERVRITCVRSSGSLDPASALSLLVGPAPDGKWLIFEELAESHR